MIEGLRTDSLLIPGTEMRASQWLAAISFLVAAGILIYNQYFRKDGLSVYGEDAEDAEEAESAEELAILDGASEDDIILEAKDDEAEDEDDEDEDDAEADDDNDEAELGMLDGASGDEVANEPDDAPEPDDDNDEAELAVLDGASGDEVEKEPDDDDSGPENKTETKLTEKKTKIKIRRKK